MRYRCLILYFLFVCCCAVVDAQDEQLTIDDQLKQYKTDQEKLTFLDSITKKMVRTNDQQKVKYLKQIVSLARKLEDYDMVARKSRFILSDMNARGLQDSVIIMANTLIKEKDKFKDPTSLAHLYLKRAAPLYLQAKHKEAIEDYERAAVIFEANDKPLFAADGYFFASHLYKNNHDFVTAVNHMKKAMQLYELGGDITYVMYVSETLTDLYDRNGLYDKALEERKSLLKKYKGQTTPTVLALNYFSISRGYKKKGLFDTQKKYLDSAFAEIPKIDDPEIQHSVPGLAMSICNAYVGYYLSIGDLESAEIYLGKAEAYFQKTPSKEFTETAMFMHRAKVLEQKKEWVSAKNFYKKVLDKGFEIEDIMHRVNAQEGLAEILAKLGDYKQANALRKEELKLKDSLDQIQQNNTLLLLQTEFETERRKKELAERTAEVKDLELEQTVARNKRILLLMSLLIVIIIAIITVYLIWQRGKRKRQQLELELLENKRDLSAFTEQLLQKSKEQAELSEKLAALKLEKGESQTFAHLEELASSKILTSEDWFNFKQKFKLVYPSFFDKLQEIDNSLTTAEERLLSLEKLDLDNNQISRILGISTTSVNQSRYRLRKKWDAPKQVALLEFLQL
ncbi:MAG: hypothetical protein AAFX55_00380 [Bacteroidota bacterium]